jgi:hypothetical protein
MLRGAETMAQRVLERNPALTQAALSQVAKQLRITPTTARRVLANVKARYRWRPLSSGAATFIARHAPMASRVALRDTRGLSDANTIYIVEPGDGPIRIGNKLLGAGFGDKNWKQLVAANPSKSKGTDGNFKILAVGERLKLPASWTAAINEKTGTPGPVVVTPSPTPTPAPVPGGTRIVVVLANEGPSQIAKAITGDGGQARTLEIRNLNIPKDADGRARKSNGQSGFTRDSTPAIGVRADELARARSSEEHHRCTDAGAAP